MKTRNKALAACAAATLAMAGAGSTYALLSAATGPITGRTTITAGSLKITNVKVGSATTWRDFGTITPQLKADGTFSNGTPIGNMAEYVLAPGGKVGVAGSLTVTASGNNLVATVKAKGGAELTPNTAENNANITISYALYKAGQNTPIATSTNGQFNMLLVPASKKYSAPDVKDPSSVQGETLQQVPIAANGTVLSVVQLVNMGSSYAGKNQSEDVAIKVKPMQLSVQQVRPYPAR